MASPEPRCRKCQSEPGARPKRHARKCPLRGIGTRRETSYLWRACFGAMRDTLDSIPRDTNDQGRVELAIATFERDVARWGRARRWLLKHRLGGSARAAFEALDRTAPMMGYGHDPVLPYPTPPLVLTPPTWGEAIGGRLMTLPGSGWVVSVVSPEHERNSSLRMMMPRRQPPPLAPWNGVYRGEAATIVYGDTGATFNAHRFQDGRLFLHLFLPDWATTELDDVAAQLESVVQLFDLARVSIPGKTEAEIARALLSKRLVRVAVETRVRTMHPHVRGWRRERALVNEAKSLLAAARRALADAERHAQAREARS